MASFTPALGSFPPHTLVPNEKTPIKGVFHLVEVRGISSRRSTRLGQGGYEGPLGCHSLLFRGTRIVAAFCRSLRFPTLRLPVSATGGGRLQCPSSLRGCLKQLECKKASPSVRVMERKELSFTLQPKKYRKQQAR